MTLTGKRLDGLLIQGSIARKEMLDVAIKHRLPTLTSIRLRPPTRSVGVIRFGLSGAGSPEHGVYRQDL